MNYRKLLQILLFISITTPHTPVFSNSTQSAAFDLKWLHRFTSSLTPQKLKLNVLQPILRNRKAQFLIEIALLATIMTILQVYTQKKYQHANTDLQNQLQHVQDQLKQIQLCDQLLYPVQSAEEHDLARDVINIYNTLFPDKKIEDNIITEEQVSEILPSLTKLQNQSQQMQALQHVLKQLYMVGFPDTQIEENDQLADDQLQALTKLLEQNIKYYNNVTYNENNDPEDSQNNQNLSHGIDNSVLFSKNDFNQIEHDSNQQYIYCDREDLDRAKEAVIQENKSIICCLKIEEPQGTWTQITLRKIKLQDIANLDSNNLDNNYNENDVEHVVIVLDSETAAQLIQEQGGQVTDLAKLLKNRAQSLTEKSEKLIVQVTYVIQNKNNIQSNLFPGIPSLQGTQCDLLVFIGAHISAEHIFAQIGQGNITQLVCAGVGSDIIAYIQNVQKDDNNILQNTKIVHFYSPMFETNDWWKNWNRKIGDGTKENNIVDVMVAALNNILEVDGFITKTNTQNGPRIQDIDYQENVFIEKSHPYLHLPSATVAKQIFGLLPGLYQTYIQNRDFYTLTDYLLMLNFHPKNHSGSAMMTFRADSTQIQYTVDEKLAGKTLDNKLLISGTLMHGISQATNTVYRLAGNQYYQKPSTEIIQRCKTSTTKGAQKTIDYCLGALKYLNDNTHYISYGVTTISNTVQNNVPGIYENAKSTITNLYQNVSKYFSSNNQEKNPQFNLEEAQRVMEEYRKAIEKSRKTQSYSLDQSIPNLDDSLLRELNQLTDDENDQ